MVESEICHIYFGVIIAIKRQLLTTGHEVHALHECLLEITLCNLFVTVVNLFYSAGPFQMKDPPQYQYYTQVYAMFNGIYTNRFGLMGFESIKSA